MSSLLIELSLLKTENSYGWCQNRVGMVSRVRRERKWWAWGDAIARKLGDFCDNCGSSSLFHLKQKGICVGVVFVCVFLL